MADLDDFFAKKDKKKGKTKKFLSSEELVKQLEQTAKEMAAEKQKPAKIDEEAEQTKITNQEVFIEYLTFVSNQSNCQCFQQDDEWNEFEEQKRPDLTNLKLGQLTIDEDDENNYNSTGNEYENENFNFDGDNSENPWKKANSTGQTGPVAVTPKPEPKVQTGAYVPPGVARSEVNIGIISFSNIQLNLKYF